MTGEPTGLSDVERDLQEALEVSDPSEKNYHVRIALQRLNILDENQFE